HTGLGALIGAALALIRKRASEDAEAKNTHKRKRRRRSAPPAPPPPRFPVQTPCSSGAQCLSGFCGFNGLAQVCCEQAGGPCTSGLDCCAAAESPSLTCRPASMTCQCCVVA